MKLQGRALEQVAGSYALGTLSSRASRRFEAHLRHDIAVRRAWQQWEERLAALRPDIPPVRPPHDAWATIEKRLARNAAPRAKPQLLWLLAAALVVGIALVMLWRKVRP